jgi:hypothetical protein
VLDAAGALTGVAPDALLYARVDLAAAGNDYLLLELELIEPSLFLLHAPNEAERFAEALLSTFTPTSPKFVNPLDAPPKPRIS